MQDINSQTLLSNSDEQNSLPQPSRRRRCLHVTPLGLLSFLRVCYICSTFSVLYTTKHSMPVCLSVSGGSSFRPPSCGVHPCVGCMDTTKYRRERSRFPTKSADKRVCRGKCCVGAAAGAFPPLLHSTSPLHIYYSRRKECHHFSICSNTLTRVSSVSFSKFTAVSMSSHVPAQDRSVCVPLLGNKMCKSLSGHHHVDTTKKWDVDVAKQLQVAKKTKGYFGEN